MSCLINGGESTLFTAGDIHKGLTSILSGKELPARTDDIVFHESSSDHKLVIHVSHPGLTVGTENNLMSFSEVDISADSLTLTVLSSDTGGGYPTSSIFVSLNNTFSPIDLEASVDSPHVTITSDIKCHHVLVLWKDLSPELFSGDMDEFRLA
jgi:hypothetical protein